MQDKKPFCFAGLWSRYADQLSCTIITTTPSPLVAPVHDRMPAILAHDAMALWSAPGAIDLDAARAVLGPYPAELMISEEADPEEAEPDVPKKSSQLDLF